MTADELEGAPRGPSRRRLLALAGLAGSGGLIASACSSPSPEQDTERDFPLQRVLPGTYRQGRDDIGPYVQDVLDRLESSDRASLLFPPGRHRWDSPCYLAAPTRDLTYELRGHGKGTVLELGPGLRDEFAIHLNQKRDGTQAVKFPRHPRLRVTDMYVTAADASIGASLCYYDEASVDVERVRFSAVKYGLTGTGYTDLMSLRQVGWEVPADGGCLYLQNGSGDGLLIEQVTASLDAVVAELNGCNGATISSCIGGCYVFTDCDAIEVVASHYDSADPDGGMASRPFVVVRSSRVAFRGGWDHVGADAAAFEVDDSDPDRYSEVVWDGYSFAFRADAPDKERAADIRVRAVQDGTKLRFRGCSSRLQATRDKRRWAVGPRLTSDDRAVQAAMNAGPTGPLEDAELVRDGGGWSFLPSQPSGGSGQPPLPVPTIDACSPTRLFPGDHRPGATHYYTLAAYGSFTGDGTSGRRAAEASTAVPRGGAAVALRISLGRPRGAVRVWRGSSSGRYDVYADLTVGAYSTLLVDTGPYVCGAAWTAQDVPVPPPGRDGQ